MQRAAKQQPHHWLCLHTYLLGWKWKRQERLGERGGMMGQFWAVLKSTLSCLCACPFIDISAYFRWCLSSFGTRVETVFSHSLEHLEQFLLHSPRRSCFPVSSCRFPTCIGGMWSIVQMMKNIAVKSVTCHTKSACTTAFSFDFWELRVFARQMVNIQACVKLSECGFSVKYSAKHVVF